VTLPEDIKKDYPMLAQPGIKWKKEELIEIQKLINEKKKADSKSNQDKDWDETRKKAEMMKAEAAMLRAKKYQGGGTGSKTNKDAVLERAKQLRKEAYEAYRDMSIKKGGESAYTGMVEENDVYQYIARVDELISKAEAKTITPAERKELEGLESVLTKGYKGAKKKAEAAELTGKLQTILEKIEKEL
jgi:hypothetical protein